MTDDVAKLGPITWRVGACARCGREAKLHAIERPDGETFGTVEVEGLDPYPLLGVTERRVCTACLQWAMEARQAA